MSKNQSSNLADISTEPSSSLAALHVQEALIKLFENTHLRWFSTILDTIELIDPADLLMYRNEITKLTFKYGFKNKKWDENLTAQQVPIKEEREEKRLKKKRIS